MHVPRFLWPLPSQRDPSYSQLPLNEHFAMEDRKTKDELEAQLSGATVHVSEKEVDTAARIGFDIDNLDPAEAEAVRKKIDRHILPLMMVLYWVQFMDKTTLGNSAILGIREANHLTVNEYNWLGTIFYISYLVFEFPQNLALQRFRVGKWMSLNVFVWAVALCAHAACHSFGGLFTVRLILGMCEGSITAGFMIVTSMFYTRQESSVRVGYWFLMNGTAQIVSGFLSFASLHIHTPSFEPWQWYMMITGVITLGVAASYWIWFPDSPATAHFLTPRERAIAIERIKVNQTGIENKHFKREQMIEALTDPKTWLFALFSCLDNIPNSLTNQRSIIVNSFGFTVLQTALLGCVDGIIEIVTIWTGVKLAARWRNSRAWVSVIYFTPNILGCFLVNFLPWENKVGLLFSVWLTGVGTTGFVLSLGWLTAVTAGHTKRVTVQAIMLIGYCVGNAAGPFMWQERFKPRNHVPWIIIGVCYVICPMLLLVIRYLLAAENRRRDAESSDDTYKDVYIDVVLDDGTTVTRDRKSVV